MHKKSHGLSFVLLVAMFLVMGLPGTADAAEDEAQESQAGVVFGFPGEDGEFVYVPSPFTIEVTWTDGSTQQFEVPDLKELIAEILDAVDVEICKPCIDEYGEIIKGLIAEVIEKINQDFIDRIGEEIKKIEIPDPGGDPPVPLLVPSGGPLMGVAMGWWLTVSVNGTGTHSAVAGSTVSLAWIDPLLRDFSCGDVKGTLTSDTRVTISYTGVPGSDSGSGDNGPLEVTGCDAVISGAQASTTPAVPFAFHKSTHTGTGTKFRYREDGTWHPAASPAAGIFGDCSAWSSWGPGPVVNSGTCDLAPA